MPVIRIDCSRITDWPSFHDVFARELGFPAFYGRGMDAWIDCLSSLDSPADGMTSVHCTPPEVLTIQLDRAELLPRRIHATLQEAVAFVNERRVDVGDAPIVALVVQQGHSG